MIMRFTALAAGAMFMAATAHAQMPRVSGEAARTPATAPQPQLRLYAQPKSVAVLPAVTAGELAAVRNANQRGAAKGQARRVVSGGVRTGAGSRAVDGGGSIHAPGGA